MAPRKRMRNPRLSITNDMTVLELVTKNDETINEIPIVKEKSTNRNNIDRKNHNSRIKESATIKKNVVNPVVVVESNDVENDIIAVPADIDVDTNDVLQETTSNNIVHKDIFSISEKYDVNDDDPIDVNMDSSMDIGKETPRKSVEYKDTTGSCINEKHDADDDVPIDVDMDGKDIGKETIDYKDTTTSCINEIHDVVNDVPIDVNMDSKDIGKEASINSTDHSDSNCISDRINGAKTLSSSMESLTATDKIHDVSSVGEEIVAPPKKRTRRGISKQTNTQQPLNRPKRKCCSENIDASLYVGEKVIHDVECWETIQLSPRTKARNIYNNSKLTGNCIDTNNPTATRVDEEQDISIMTICNVESSIDTSHVEEKSKGESDPSKIEDTQQTVSKMGRICQLHAPQERDSTTTSNSTAVVAKTTSTNSANDDGDHDTNDNNGKQNIPSNFSWKFTNETINMTLNTPNEMRNRSTSGTARAGTITTAIKTTIANVNKEEEQIIPIKYTCKNGTSHDVCGEKKKLKDDAMSTDISEVNKNIPRNTAAVSQIERSQRKRNKQMSKEAVVRSTRTSANNDNVVKGIPKKSTRTIKTLHENESSMSGEPINNGKKEGRLIVYSSTHQHLYGEGNKDFLFMIRSFQYEYLAEGATNEIRASILDYIQNQYHFYKLDGKQARLKISKAVSDNRKLNIAYIEDDMNMRMKYTLPWVQQFLKIEDPITEYYPFVKYNDSFNLIAKRNRGKKILKHCAENYGSESSSYIAKIDRLQSNYLHEFDQNQHYVEELAYHRYYDQEYEIRQWNNGEKGEQVQAQLDPLPPPPPIPTPPLLMDANRSNNSNVNWTYNPSTRVYLGDFTNATEIPLIHKQFLGTLMERDDITVICEGLYKKQINVKKFLIDLADNFGSIPYSKFRQFDRKQSSVDEEFKNNNNSSEQLYHYEEVDGYRTLNVASEYLPYIAKSVYGAQDVVSCTFSQEVKVEDSEECQCKIGEQIVFVSDSEKSKDCGFTEDEKITAERSRNNNGICSKRSQDVNVDPCSCIYMTDVEMATHVPRFDHEYKQQFKIKEILPGGAWCLMHNLPEQSRPFMGPNLYISPGGGYTQFHQDGHGTVDSGHSCLSGYNEVIMLRRLPECHKLQACQLIPSVTNDANASVSLRKKQAENVLYRLPHDDFREDKLKWAQVQTIKQWEKLGYCPSLFILKPGQHLLINKGRLHAFRKLTFDELPHQDCHAQLRKSLVAELRSKNILRPPLCISVAFDWSFSGITAEGVNRELAAALDSASYCRKYKTCKSLAIPETAIMRIADSVPSDIERNNSLQHTPLGLHRTLYLVSWWEIVRGILPSLRYLTARDNNVSITNSKNVLHSELPDTHPEAQNNTDPYGNDYFCKICSRELANTYFHCHGCETLLAKDFNICIECLKDQAYATNVEMHQWNCMQMASHFHHMGNPKRSCSNTADHNMICAECKKCMHCNCCCHTVFQKRHRFFTEERQLWVLDRCTDLIRGSEIKYSFETECQLNKKPLISKFEEIAVDIQESDALLQDHEKNVHYPTEVVDFQNEYRIIPCVSLETELFKKDELTVRKPIYNDLGHNIGRPPCRTAEIQRVDFNQTKVTGDGQRDPNKGISGHFLHETAIIRMATEASINDRRGMRICVSHKPFTVSDCTDENVEYDAV